MFQTPDQLCKRFNYPASLQALLEQLLVLAEQHIPHLHSLLLTGSVATGDFVYEREGEQRFFSDIDAFIYLESSARYSPTTNPEWERNFFQAIAELESQVDSPLFHIDVSINSQTSLSHLPNSFQFAEVRESGVVIAGEDITYAFPNHFEATSVQQAYLLHFTKGMLYWPGPKAAADPVYAQVLARMVLDLPLLSFAKEEHCISGHQERAKAFLALPPSHPMLTDETREAIGLAVSLRRGEPIHHARLQDLLLPCIDVALNALDHSGSAPRCPDVVSVRRLAKLLPRRSLRRLAGDLLLASQLQQPLTSKIRFLSSSNEAKLAALNLSLLAYAANGAEGDPPPELAAQAASFSDEAASTAAGFQFYCEVRRQLLTGLCRYSRSWREKESFYLKVIQRAEAGGW